MNFIRERRWELGSMLSIPSSLASQTHQTMENISNLLPKLGLDMQAIVKCTVMLADINSWHNLNGNNLKYFAADRLPARGEFGAAELVAGALIKIDVLLTC